MTQSSNSCSRIRSKRLGQYLKLRFLSHGRHISLRQLSSFMENEVQLAVAGSGKTAEIVRRIKNQSSSTSSVALAFTTYAQNEIEGRIPNHIESRHETMGWFAFLV